MIREVDLLSYLPPYLQEFQEMGATLDAENPEFILVWEATDKVLKNEFIETADEYGISRFEKILGILVSKEDTLESRRARVQSRWFNTIPYTMKSLLSKLEKLCGDTEFTVTKYFDYYKLEIETDLELFGQVEELESVITEMLPCNMVVISNNNIPCSASGFSLIAGGVVSTETFFITNDSKITHTIEGVANVGGGIVAADKYMITNDFTENDSISSEANFGGGITNTVKVIITNDFNEQFNINGSAKAGAGVTVTEFIETQTT